MKGDFGTLTLAGVQVRGSTATLRIRGATGSEARCELTLEDAPASRIAGVAIRVGGPDNEEAAAPPPPVNAAMSPAELSKALDGYLAPMAAGDTFAGVVLVATDGKTVFEKAYGQADRQKRLPMTPAMRFNVGSIGRCSPGRPSRNSSHRASWR